MKSRHSLVIVVLMVYLLAACSAEQLRSGRQAGVTATPTRTPKPTFTATLPPTNTPTPSPTPLPTDTPTHTPVPTDTPPPTAVVVTIPPTAVPLPSATPRPTAKPTSRPRPKPTAAPPKPTNTPAPPFRVEIAKGYARCDGYRGVTGTAIHANKAPYPGVSVGVWSDSWEDGRVGASQGEGKFDINLSDLPVGTFHAAVIKAEGCEQRNGAPVVKNCQKLSNVKDFAITDKCTGAGASQVTELAVYGP